MHIPLPAGLGCLEAHFGPHIPDNNPLFRPSPPSIFKIRNDPFYSDNCRSENATKRLLTCTANRFDVLKVLSQPDNVTTDINDDTKRTLTACIDAVNFLADENPLVKEMRLLAILYHWEIFTGFGITKGDFSDLVFTDHSQTKYFLLTCLPFKEDRPDSPRKSDDEAILKRQALRFLALADYLPIPKPKFVRATLLSLNYDAFNPAFFDPSSDFTSSSTSISSSPKVFHFTQDDLVPTFTIEEFTKIDKYLKTFGVVGDQTSKSKTLLTPETAESEFNSMKVVCQSKFGKAYYELLDQRYCGHCAKYFTVLQLKACSLCCAELYCSVECQKKDWKDHKRLCKDSCRIVKSTSRS